MHEYERADQGITVMISCVTGAFMKQDTISTAAKLTTDLLSFQTLCTNGSTMPEFSTVEVTVLWKLPVLSIKN